MGVSHATYHAEPLRPISVTIDCPLIPVQRPSDGKTYPRPRGQDDVQAAVSHNTTQTGGGSNVVLVLHHYVGIAGCEALTKDLSSLFNSD